MGYYNEPESIASAQWTHQASTPLLLYRSCPPESGVKAASLLGLSQPAVSKTIHELEDCLSAALFEPKRRSMVLTPLGDIFLRYTMSSLVTLKP
ncbi:LysR family transcriptional regulator [Chelatococcus sp. GCM10030263]|uniref:LysR family transcriptional regulator n=1 Tax=Chelatococcus sp. GCM10030263 TaxID=3273387 RepID=UPI003621E30A